jgi:heptosyltransferase II
MSAFTPAKILLRSPNWVGDAIMATPVPGALKRAWPASRVHVLARPWAAPVWEHHPEVEKIIVLGDGGASPGSLRAEKYDLGLVLPNSFSSAWLAWRAGCRARVGYAAEHRTWLLTVRVPWTAAARAAARPQTYLDLARAAGAGETAGGEFKFTLALTLAEGERARALLGGEDGRPWVGLAPGSVAPSRRWPAERYAQLADRLAAHGCRVVLIGSGADAAEAQSVAARMQHPPLILAGKTKLREALAVISRLALLVSNDSGSMHAAYAQGVPVLVLQGAADPNVTGPFGPSGRVLRAAGLDCAPCVRNECTRGLECMLAISVEQAWDAAAGLLPRLGK